jgi:hypothetical protein
MLVDCLLCQFLGLIQERVLWVRERTHNPLGDQIWITAYELIKKKEAIKNCIGLAHEKKSQEKPIITNLQKKGFEHIELPAKLLDHFLWSDKSNINQSSGTHTHGVR